MTDVCPFTLGTSVHNKSDPSKPLFSPIIQRNSALPCRRTNTYYPVDDFQTQLSVDVYQGEQMYAKDNLYLGEYEVSIPARPKGKESIDVSFTYDINGILVVDVKVNSSGKYVRHLLTGKGQITEEQIQQRLRELSSLPLTPQDDERYRNLCAKTESFYAQSTGVLRENIAHIYTEFQAKIDKAGSAAMERLLLRWQKLLDTLEKQVLGMGTLPSDIPNEELEDDGELFEHEESTAAEVTDSDADNAPESDSRATPTSAASQSATTANTNDDNAERDTGRLLDTSPDTIRKQ